MEATRATNPIAACIPLTYSWSTRDQTPRHLDSTVGNNRNAAIPIGHCGYSAKEETIRCNSRIGMASTSQGETQLEKKYIIYGEWRTEIYNRPPYTEQTVDEEATWSDSKGEGADEGRDRIEPDNEGVLQLEGGSSDVVPLANGRLRTISEL